MLILNILLLQYVFRLTCDEMKLGVISCSANGSSRPCSICSDIQAIKFDTKILNYLQRLKEQHKQM